MTAVAVMGCSAPGLVLALFVSACGQGSTARVVPHTPVQDTILRAPAESTLKLDLLSQSIRRGRALARATRDSLPSNVENELACVSCHQVDGTRAYAMPWIGAYGRFPQYRSRSAKVARLEDRINDCFQRSMNGTPLPVQGDDMRDIVSYISWLSRSTVLGSRAWGTGIDSIGPLLPDTARGLAAYFANCVRCHGPDGAGRKSADTLSSGPPLWGRGSFSIGSGMARVRVLAAFIHRNMPRDTPGRLSVQSAFDIAGLVATRVRPDFAGKALDWPNGDPPPDVAYGTLARRRAAPITKTPR